MLKKRISELEAEIKAYNELLAELTDVFEHRFKQRLEPLMERYQLLAEQVDQEQFVRSQPALPGSSEPDNVVRYPGLRLPKFLQNCSVQLERRWDADQSRVGRPQT